MRCIHFSKLFLIFTILLIFGSFLVVAQTTNSTQDDRTSNGFDEQKSYDYLKNSSASQVGNLLDQALVIMALNNKNINVQKFVDMLKLQEDVSGCFPKGNCKVADTALGLLAYYSSNQDITKAKNYLLKGSALTPGLKQGEWRLQLDLQGSGACKIDYGENNKSKVFTIDNGTIKGATGKYFIDVAKELDLSLTSMKVSQLISVDCKDLAGVVSLVYYLKPSNSFFVLDSQSLSAGAANLKIINGCFRSISGTGSCDLDSSLYSTWALVEADIPLGEIGTLAYLESNSASGNINDLEKAILVRILQKSGNANSYFDNLLISNLKNGALGRGDIYITAWGLFALQKASGAYGDFIQSSKGFLEKKVNNDGSYGSIKNTAMVLIAFHGPEISRGFVTASIGTGLNKDDVCSGKSKDTFQRTGCSSLLCKSESQCLCENIELNCGGPCEPCPLVEENVSNQEQAPVVKETKAQPIVTESSWFGASSLFILILLLVGAGIIFYLKSQGKLEVLTGLFKRKPKSQSFEEYKKQTQSRTVQKPVQQPSRPMPQQFKPSMPLKKPNYDDALEKSLKEAEKLLKQK